MSDDDFLIYSIDDYRNDTPSLWEAVIAVRDLLVIVSVFILAFAAFC